VVQYGPLEILTVKRHEVEHAIRQRYLPVARVRGGPLPSIRAIAGELGVSKETVRRAVDSLRERGEVTTRHGAGVFPAPGGAAMAPAGDPGAPSSMFDLDEHEAPVIRCLVKDNRENPALQQITAAFNEQGRRCRVALHHRPDLDRLRPVHDFDILLAGADLVGVWHSLVGFRELQGLTDTNLDEVLSRMFPLCRASCRTTDGIIGIPLLVTSYPLFAHEAFLEERSSTTTPLPPHGGRGARGGTSEGSGGKPEAASTALRRRSGPKSAFSGRSRHTPRAPCEIQHSSAVADLDWAGFLELAEPYLRGESAARGTFARRLTILFFAAGLWPGVDGQRMVPDRTRMRQALEAMREGAELFSRPREGPRRDALAEFADGALPFLVTGTGNLRRVLETCDEDVVALPVPFGRKRIMGGAILGVVHPDCLHPRQAMEYLLFLAERPSQEALARGGLDLPARTDCYEAAWPDQRFRRLNGQILECTGRAESMHSGVEPFGSLFMREEVFPQVHLYLDGEVELDEALDAVERLARRFEKRIARLVSTQGAQERPTTERRA
jgi:hypothetical protein